MAKINAVLGEIDINNLGETLFHEHVACVNPAFRFAFGNKYFPREKVLERAVNLLIQARNECGVQTIIDATPVDLGRDVELIKEVSLLTKVNVLVSSGIYCNEEEFLKDKSPQKRASFFIDEFENGIQGTSVKPAILKCATSDKGVTPINAMILTALSLTQKETGLPLYCHNVHSKQTADEQLKLLDKNGVDFSKVVIGHCSDCYDEKYLESIAKNGCYLSFDRIHPDLFEKQARIIAKLIENGFEDKLLVSHDYFAYLDYGDREFENERLSNKNFCTVHKKLLPALLSFGIKENQVKKLTIDNPKRVLLVK